jgi:diaminopimelate decarboxylase
VIESTIWPRGTVVGRDGHIRIRTHDLPALADRHGTPLYVYDAETIRASLHEYVDAFFRYRPVRVAYSVKACALIGVGSVIAREGIDASVASLGELQAARRAGFPVSRMELHGNAKPDDEVAGALEARVGRFVIDGAHDIERLARLTLGRRRPQPVWLRVAPGIAVDTHPHLVTGTVDSKFGAPMCACMPTRARPFTFAISRARSSPSRTRCVPRPAHRSPSSGWAAVSPCASARAKRLPSSTITRAP